MRIFLKVKVSRILGIILVAVYRYLNYFYFFFFLSFCFFLSDVEGSNFSVLKSSSKHRYFLSAVATSLTI